MEPLDFFLMPLERFPGERDAVFLEILRIFAFLLLPFDEFFDVALGDFNLWLVFFLCLGLLYFI
jgi:hypothetical protein